MSILSAEGLVKTYQRRRVVDGVDLQVEAGEIAGLLGPNGAGKSTCFKMICGLVRPDKGRVFLMDQEVTRLPLFQRSRLGMGYLPQQSSLFNKLSVQANLLGMMQLLGYHRKERKMRCEQLLEQFNIKHVRKSKAETLSGGERRRLEIARCLVSNPQIIMLDEPFAAIDPVTVQNIQQIIRELAQRGIAILITDHAAREILQITDRTYVVNDGRILCSGSAAEITSHPEVKQKYLGELDWISNSGNSGKTATTADLHQPIRFNTDVLSQRTESSPVRSSSGTDLSDRPAQRDQAASTSFGHFSQRVDAHSDQNNHPYSRSTAGRPNQSDSDQLSPPASDRLTESATDAISQGNTDRVIQPRRSRIIFSDMRKFRADQ